MNGAHRKHTHIDTFTILFWASVTTFLLTGPGYAAPANSHTAPGVSTSVYTSHPDESVTIRASQASTHNHSGQLVATTDEQTGEDNEEERAKAEKPYSCNSTRLSDESFLDTSPNRSPSTLPLYLLFEVYRT